MYGNYMGDIGCDFCQMPTCRCCSSCGGDPCDCDQGETSAAAFNEKREDWLTGMNHLHRYEIIFGPQELTRAERAQLAVYKTFRGLFK